MSDVFSDAIVAYLGYGGAASPQANAGVADPLVRRKLQDIFDFADQLEPDWDRLDLAQAGEWASEVIAARYPYLTKRALDALAWSCTFGWK